MNRVNTLFACALLSLMPWKEACAQETVRPEQASVIDKKLLQVSAFLEPADSVIARQNVKLVIETATSGWYTGGSKITLPDVPGLLFLQNEKFASNSSERRSGKTWVVQRWSVDVFPLQAGIYAIPPIELAVRLKTPENLEFEGLAKTESVELVALLPPTLEHIDDWVASPQYSVSQTFDRPLDALSVGDAVEQSIEFRAANVMAMMLPVYEHPTINGLAAYPAPPVLNNQVNRGESTATRVSKISYIIEKPGQFVIPTQEYFWWNTRESSLEIITVPAVTLNAAGPAMADHELRSRHPGMLILATTAVLGFLGLAAALVAVGKKRHFRNSVELILLKLKRAIVRFTRPALPEKLNP